MQQRFIGSDQADLFIRSRYPEISEITVVEHGFHNVVAIADKRWVFRFPRNEISATRQIYESKVLEDLKDKLSLPIPKLISIFEDPGYMVTEYLPGNIVDIDSVNNYSDSVTSSIAAQLAGFMLELNKAISTYQLDRLRTVSGLAKYDDDLWNNYFIRTLKKASFPDKPWLETLAHDQYDLWSQVDKTTKLKTISVHDDLHLGNLLFEGNKISGILDFGYAKSGNTAQELRLLYLINESLISQVLNQYCKLANTEIHREEIICWAIASELASYCDRLARSELNHPSFSRAQNNLKRLLPEYQDKF